MLGPQTGNVFLLISSVRFQHRDAFILVQKGLWKTIQRDIKSKMTADDRTDERMDILYCHSWVLNPCHVAACADYNYGPHK